MGTRFSILLLFLLISSVAFSQKIRITPQELPHPITTFLADKYAKYSIEKVKKITKNSTITYAVDVQKKTTLYQFIFDEKGAVLERVKSKSFTYDNSMQETLKKDREYNTTNEPPVPPF